MQNFNRRVEGLLGLKTMQETSALNSHCFNSFQKQVFFNMFIKHRLKLINYDGIPIITKQFQRKTKKVERIKHYL